MTLKISPRLNDFRLSVALLLILFVPASPSWAQDAPSPAQGSTSSGQETASPTAELANSLQEKLEAENQDLANLKDKLEKAQRLAKNLESEINAYTVQLSAYKNLLSLPTIQISDLKKIQSNIVGTLSGISERFGRMQDERKSFSQVRQKTEEQYLLSENQLAALEAKGAKGQQTEKILKHLRELKKALSAKRQLLEKTDAIYAEYTTQLSGLEKEFAQISDKVETQIQEQQNRNLFERSESPLLAAWGNIPEALTRSWFQIQRLFTASFWGEQGREIWKSADSLVLTFLLLFAVTQAFLFRLRKWCMKIERSAWSERHPWGCVSLRLVHRSIPLIGAVVLLYGYAKAHHLYVTVPLIHVTAYILLIWLFSKWALDLLRILQEGDTPKIPASLASRARLLIFCVRAFLIVYVLLEWALGAGIVLLFWRVLFELLFFGWSFSFWKRFRAAAEVALSQKLRSFFVGLGYLVAGGGLFLELAGYGQLAFYWFLSWGRMAAALLWAGVLALVIRELAERHRQTSSDQSALTRTVQPIHWFLIQVSWLGWFGALCVGLLFAWGATQAIIIGFFKVFSYPIRVGQMQFSLLGLLYAVLVLLCTSAATRLWRHVLKERILEGSGLELGLRESITTISVYLFWSLGILASLYAFGLSTTSLAVAFGALGIGLGFGLQTIFNNFVSGLILLFERPIQVGDVVEVDGTWGTIIKINVRSTVVQTYDNASLIIPNSEFVSGRLTNWSFKDMRVRRNVSVGVAYGSEVEKVRQTLLEAASKHAHILKMPQPDVLFTDFADSSLVFKLRFWTTIDYALSTETDLRFEIDRLFKERGIQIPFPQRDLHLIGKAVIAEETAAEEESSEAAAFSKSRS